MVVVTFALLFSISSYSYFTDGVVPSTISSQQLSTNASSPHTTSPPTTYVNGRANERTTVAEGFESTSFESTTITSTKHPGLTTPVLPIGGTQSSRPSVLTSPSTTSHFGHQTSSAAYSSSASARFDYCRAYCLNIYNRSIMHTSCFLCYGFWNAL